MNNINKVKIINDHNWNEMTFYDVNLFDPFLFNDILYFKISSEEAFNPESNQSLKCTPTSCVQDCNLEIKIIK